MKKAKFYTLGFSKKVHGVVATLREGWTDGMFNYYKHAEDDCWYAVFPEVGLSVCSGATKNAVAEQANTPEMLERIHKKMQSREMDGMQQSFQKCVAESTKREVK